MINQIKEILKNLIEQDTAKDVESLQSYLHRSLIADDILDIAFLENFSKNEIEYKLSRSLENIFTSEDFENQGLKLTDNISTADCVIFMLSERLDEQTYKKLKNLEDDVIKIGFITSSAKNPYDFKDIKNLILITQAIESSYSKNKLKAAMNISNDAKLVRLPISPFIHIKRDPSINNKFEVDYALYTEEIGLYELMAAALPTKYSELHIKCPSPEDAQNLKSKLIYSKNNAFTIQNICIIRPESIGLYEESAIKKHATIKLLKIIRNALMEKVYG